MTATTTVIHLHSLFKAKFKEQLNLDLGELTVSTKNQVYISNNNRLRLSEAAKDLELTLTEHSLMTEFLQKLQDLSLLTKKSMDVINVIRHQPTN